jgi:hypothetical protein
MSKNTTVSIEMIKPNEAQQLLETRSEQERHVRATAVARYTTEILSGRWRISADAIVIVRGALMNGQHRLMAVKRANKACEFLVFRTDDERIYEILDCGVKRTVSDVLSAKDIKYASVVAGASRLAIAYDRDLISFGGGKGQGVITRGEIAEYAQKNADRLSGIAAAIQPFYFKHPIISITTAVFLWEIGQRKNAKKTEEFITSFFTGENLTYNNAAYVLREKFITSRVMRGDVVAVDLSVNRKIAFAVKALRAHLNGESVTVLKIGDKEKFPRL